MSVKILSTAAQLYEKFGFRKPAIGERSGRSLWIIENSDLIGYITLSISLNGR